MILADLLEVVQFSVTRANLRLPTCTTSVPASSFSALSLTTAPSMRTPPPSTRRIASLLEGARLACLSSAPMPSGAPESDDEGWEDEDTAAAEGEAGGAAGAEEAGDAASPEAPAAPVAPTPAKIPAQFMLDGAGLSARGDLCRR